MCESYIDCNSRGDCIDNLCNCYIGWFYYNCSTNIMDLWPESFYVYTVILLI